MGDIHDSHTPSRFGGVLRGALRRRVQFERRIAWRRSAGGAGRHRIALFREDEHRSDLGMGGRSHHSAARLGESHAIGHWDNPLEALDDIGRTNASDKRHRPVSVPPRLFAIRDASHVRDAPKTDRFGGLHALFEQPDRVIADFHGASERRQVHENQTVFDRDGVRSAIRSRNERCGVLPFQLACLGYGKLLQCQPTAVRRRVGGFRVA